MSASNSAEGTGPRWSLATRIAFRFFFCFFLLHLPLPLFFNLNRFLPMSRAFWGAIVPVVARSVFGVTAKLEPNGSGDTTWDWMQLFTIVMISLLVTIVWSLVDRRRAAYPRLFVVLRIYLRYALAFAMFAYGISKVIPMQFQPPSLDRLTQRIGDTSPMGLLWTFMGASVAYTIFAGLGEFIGGLLLTTRRTALLGALVSAAVLVNVVMMNFSYDVPVKIYSSALLLTALFIAAPDAKRLRDFFVLNRPVEAAPLRPSVRLPWLSNTLRVARTLLVVWFVWMSFQRTLGLRSRFVTNDTRTALHGIWNVDELTIDGVSHPPLLSDATRWRRIVFTGMRLASIDRMDDHRERYTVSHDPTGFILRKRDDPLWQGSFFTERPDPNTLRIRGFVEGKKMTATLHRTPMPDFVLTTRGFHWINDQPFNR